MGVKKDNSTTPKTIKHECQTSGVSWIFLEGDGEGQFFEKNFGNF